MSERCPVKRVHAFNDWLAARATVVFGSMAMTYAFFLYGFIPVVMPSSMTTALYISNTIQLWSLPLLMVGSNVLGRAAERRALETHDSVKESKATLLEEIALVREDHAALAGLVSELHALLIPADASSKQAVAEPAGPQ